MSHLWIEISDGEWSPSALGDDGRELGAARMLRRVSPAGDVWVLLGPASARVNGVALDLGIRVLSDRDELRVDGTRSYFSTETLAAIEAFPGGDRPIVCPRCKTEIAPGSPAVRCPTCRVWHHESAAQPDPRPCFSYGPRCAGDCGQATAFDAGYRWTPESL